MLSSGEHRGHCYVPGAAQKILALRRLLNGRQASMHKKSTEKLFSGVPVVAQRVKSPTSIHKEVGLIPGLDQWVKDPALLRAVA